MIKRINALLIAMIIMLSFTSCRWDIWGSAIKNYGPGTGSVSSAEVFRGEKPMYLSATQARFSSAISLSWNEVKGADYYEVYRTEARNIGVTPASSEWVRLDSAPSAGSVSYADTDVEPGRIYAYKVRARSYTERTLLGEFSDISYGWLLTPPSGLTASQGASEDTIFLEWSPLSSISGYRIYWSPTGYEGDWREAVPAGESSSSYVFAPNVTMFDFHPTTAKGKNVYFAIASVGYTGDVSIKSASRVGYTFVPGAPSKPTGFSAWRGKDPDRIRLEWDIQKGRNPENPEEIVDLAWEIYRASESETETLVYSSENSGMPAEEDGKYVFLDSQGLKGGIAYTYSIRAIGRIKEGDEILSVNSLPASAEGFLLSPPTELLSVEIVNEPAVGFRVVFSPALGMDEAHDPEWTYTVKGKKRLEDDWTVIYDGIPASQNEFFSEYRLDADDRRGFEYFTICTNGEQFDTGTRATSRGYDEVVGTPIMVRRPAKADSFAASDNRVLEGTEASDGVYPMFLTMTPDSDAVSYNVKAWSTKPASADSPSDASFTGIVPSPSGGMATIRLLYSTPIGEKHWFAVQGVDKLGRVGEWSLLDDGYSAITGDKLVEYMSVFALKPWEHIGKEHFQDYKAKYGTDLDAKWRSSKIYAKIQQAGTGSLSDGITEYSEFNNGTITYVATVQGLGGRVSFTYSSFGELPYLYTNGSFVMVVSMSGSGSCTGAISVGGMYPASIGFENISVSSQRFVGTYTVVQENGTGAEEIAPL